MIELSLLILVCILGMVFLIVGYVLGKKFGEEKRDREWQDFLPKIREEAIKKSRAVLGGQFSEQLAPYLPNFPYSPTEARFVGKPIDFIIFKGMDEKEITDVIFVEVKSGKSTVSSQEKRLRQVIKEKKVHWEEYRVPEEITRKRE